MTLPTRLGCFLLVGLWILPGSAGQAEPPPADDSPVPLDAVFEGNDLPQISRQDFLKRFAVFQVPRVAVLPSAVGFSRIARREGRKATLFQLDADDATFVFRREQMTYINVHFLARERGVKMDRPEFERLLAKCIEAISGKTGVVPVKEKTAEFAGSTVSPTCRWPGTAFALNYSYRIEDPARRLPFQAEYISMRLPER